VGAFSLKMSIVTSGETIVRIKKSQGCKNGTVLLYHHAKHGGDRGSRAGCRRKSVIFLSVFLSRFGMTKFVITETLWSGVLFKTVMVSLHRGRFLVVHLHSTFSTNPQNVSIGANLYQKVHFFRDFWGCRPTFFKARTVKFGDDLGLAPPSQIL